MGYHFTVCNTAAENGVEFHAGGIRQSFFLGTGTCCFSFDKGQVQIENKAEGYTAFFRYGSVQYYIFQFLLL